VTPSSVTLAALQRLCLRSLFYAVQQSLSNVCAQSQTCTTAQWGVYLTHFGLNNSHSGKDQSVCQPAFIYFFLWKLSAAQLKPNG